MVPRRGLIGKEYVPLRMGLETLTLAPPAHSKLSNQFLILNALWHQVSTKAFFLVFFVFREGSLEKVHFRIPFKGQNMGTDPIQEPPVVRNNHRTSCKILQPFFQCS